MRSLLYRPHRHPEILRLRRKKTLSPGAITPLVKASILTYPVTTRAPPRHFNSPIQRGAHQPHGPLRLFLTLALRRPSFLPLFSPRTKQFDPNEPTHSCGHCPRPYIEPQRSTGFVMYAAGAKINLNDSF